MKDNSFADIDGFRVRRQYFNYFLCIPVLIFLYYFIVRTFGFIAGGHFDFQQWLYTMYKLVLRLGVMSLPFAVLSLLNMFFFGRVVCVINEDGIHHRNGLIRWNDVLYLKYEAVDFGSLFRRQYYPTYITVGCPQQRIEITYAPFFMFFIVKKYKPSIRLKTDILIPIVIGAVIVGAVLNLLSDSYLI